MSEPSFTPDPQLQDVATRASEKCVAYLRQKFGKVPDYSDTFVVEIEAVLNLLHLQMPIAKPTESDMEDFAMLFGSYLGETYRRNHGGVWGTVDGTPALLMHSGYKSFPWMRVYKRLKNGFEDNVHHWYTLMIEYGAGSPPPLPPGPPPLPPR